MNWKKKLLALGLSLALTLSLTACGQKAAEPEQSEEPAQTEEPVVEAPDGTEADIAHFRIAALKGPTAMGLVKLMKDNDEMTGALLSSAKPYEGEVGNLYTFTLAGSADEVTPALLQGDLDVACVPANLASVLYNKTGGDIVTLAINTLGVLYVVENGNAVQSMADLTGKTIVVKYGGNAMVSDELRRAVMCDIILLSLVGIRVVVVHGGGPEISEMLKKLGHESRFVDGLRYTDAETMDVVQSVLCGKVNKNLVAQLNRLGGQAIGLCGMDGQLFQAEQLDEKYGLVGKITGVNPEPVENALLSGYIPVVSTVAQGVDADTAYNINADTAASKLAAAMGAEKLILLTDVRGLLRNPRDEETLIHVVHTYDVPGLVAQGIISGGMIPKMECCVDAIAGGVERVHILDGRIPHSILIELLSDRGIGTMLKKEDEA